MTTPARLTIAQAALVLGMSERTLRRRVADGKIEAVKDTTPETGCAWFIEQATVDVLLARPPRRATGVPVEEQEEEIAVLACVEPERPAPAQSAELARLRDDVQQIKAFLVGQEMAEGISELPPNLGTVIGQAMRETLAPLVERIEQQSAENALLKHELGQALERVAQAEARKVEAQTERDLLQLRAQQRRGVGAWWPFFKRHG